MNTFSNIRKFIIENLEGKKKKIALELFYDLKNKRTREKEYIWDLIYDELVINNYKIIRPNYILDQLDFIIETPFIIEQITKFVEIIRLVLDYDQMLNHKEIATKLAPKFDITKEALAIQIQEITSYLDNKDSFNKRERFPQITFPKQPPMISEFAEELLLPNFNKLFSHLREVNRLKGFPDHILESFKDPNTNDERISNFCGRLTNIHENRKIQRSIKTRFVERLINKGIINTFFMEDHPDSSGLDSFSKTLWNLCYYCRNIHYEKKQIWAGHGSPAHEVVLPKIFNELSEVVAIEIPIWNDYGVRYLTGHIDSLLKIVTGIGIGDYKPNETPYFSKKFANSCFLNSIHQVAMYTLEVSNLFDIKNILCITYNKQGAWYYKPKPVLRELKQFLDNHSIPAEKRPWKEYINF